MLLSLFTLLCLISITLIIISFVSTAWRLKKFVANKYYFTAAIYGFPIPINKDNSLNLENDDLKKYNKLVYIQIVTLVTGFLFLLLSLAIGVLIDNDIIKRGVYGQGIVKTVSGEGLTFELVVNGKIYLLSCTNCYGAVGQEISIKYLPENPNQFVQEYKK